MLRMSTGYLSLLKLETCSVWDGIMTSFMYGTLCWCRKQSVLNVERVATLLGVVRTNNTSLAGARDFVFFVVDWAMTHLLALVTTILRTLR